MAAEIQAVEGLDIPAFEVNPEGTDIELPTGETIPELFTESSSKAVISKLKSLSPEDLTLQLEIIRGSFGAKSIEEADCIVLSHKNNLQSLESSLTSEQLVQEAVAIAQELQQRGIYNDEGVSWIRLRIET